MVINVLDAGVIGNGVVDDSPVINTILASCGSEPVYLPRNHIYLVKQPLELKRGLTLFGGGRQSVIRADYTAGAVNRIIGNDWVNGSPDITLSDFSVDRSGPNAQHGMILRGVSNLIIERVNVFGAPSVASGAISISGLYNGQPSLISRNVVIRNCALAQTGNFGIQLGYTDGAIVSGNTLVDSFRESIGVEPDGAGSSARNISITDNDIFPMHVYGGSVTGCLIVTESSGYPIDNVTIMNNRVRNAGAPNENMQLGLLVLGGRNISIRDNLFQNLDVQGIQIGNLAYPTSGVIADGNIILDCNPTGYAVGFSNSHYNQLLNTYVAGSASVYGEINGAADNVVTGSIVGNTLDGLALAVAINPPSTGLLY